MKPLLLPLLCNRVPFPLPPGITQLAMGVGDNALGRNGQSG